MGTKISALTETGSAPTGAYYPLEYDNANYKISTETLRDSLGGKYTEGYASSIGGTTVDDGALLTVNHNLGTEDVIVQVYIADDADGTNNVMLNNQSDGQGSYVYDYQVQAAATNSIKVQLSASGWSKNDGTSTVIHTNYRFGGTSKFIKVVVLSAGTGLGGRYVADWAQSHGGVTVQNGATLTVTHDLGTTDVIVKAYVNTSAASDTGAYELSFGGGAPEHPSSTNGAQVKDLSSNSLVFQLAADGFLAFDSSGETASATSFSSCYIKVVVLAAGASGGGANKYVADWGQSHGGVTVANGATMTITHNLGTADVQVMVYVNASASNTDAQEVGMMVHNSAGQFDCGSLVTSLATNSIVVQLGQDGYNDITSGGGLNTVSFASKYLKIVVIG